MVEVTARGLRFHVQHLGEPDDARPTVVFIHGLVMDNLSSWYFTMANPVARALPVLLYDLRGHGRSERPPSGYGLESMVEDLHAILEAAGHGGGRVALVGNSFGGLLALTYALRHPTRVCGLAMVDAHLGVQGWGGQMAATLELQGEERDRKIAESFQSWLGRHSDRKRNRLARAARALIYETSLIADLRASEEPAHEAALRGLAVPVLALYGGDSDILVRGRWLSQVLPACRLEVFPGCSHSILWEATDAVRERLVRWARALVEG